MKLGMDSQVPAIRHNTNPERQEGMVMLVKWFFFETKLGERLLVYFERKTGLAVVSEPWLSDQPAYEPKAEVQ